MPKSDDACVPKSFLKIVLLSLSSPVKVGVVGPSTWLQK